MSLRRRFHHARLFAALTFASILMTLPFSESVIARDFRDAVNEAVGILGKSRPGGVGSRENQQAVITLVTAGEKSLRPLLEGFRDATPEGKNWLHNTFEQIADRILQSRKSLPASILEDFILNGSNDSAARRLAYETLLRQDPGLSKRLIPSMLMDAGQEFRRDAVTMLLDQAESADAAVAVSLYRRALSGAVHSDQVGKIADRLRQAGEEVDISQHFGFVTEWKVVGPFDNREEKGFAIAYPPEKEVESANPFAAEYEGMTGPVNWQQLVSKDDYGVVDIAKQLENFKGSLMYLTTTWVSPAKQSLQIRLGTPNAWKLWVNGKQIFQREEYHRSTRMDQYVVPVELNAGGNQLFLKLCQNEQTQDWAQKYQFQLRVSDAAGAGVLQGQAVAQNVYAEEELR